MMAAIKKKRFQTEAINKREKKRSKKETIGAKNVRSIIV
jgi:hypothetical protein